MATCCSKRFNGNNRARSIPVRENSSGEHKGKTTISKRGRSRLSAILFRAILPLTAKNSEFNALHKYNTFN
jgi:transposase